MEVTSCQNFVSFWWNHVKSLLYLNIYMKFRKLRKQSLVHVDTSMSPIRCWSWNYCLSPNKIKSAVVRHIQYVERTLLILYRKINWTDTRIPFKPPCSQTSSLQLCSKATFQELFGGFCILKIHAAQVSWVVGGKLILSRNVWNQMGSPMAHRCVRLG